MDGGTKVMDAVVETILPSLRKTFTVDVTGVELAPAVLKVSEFTVTL